MIIRPATAADVSTVADLNNVVQQLHAAAEPGFFKPADNQAEVADFFEEQLARPQAFVYLAEIEGQAAGYLFATVEAWPKNSFRYAQRRVHVHHLAVASGYRRRGVGTRLMERARQLAVDEAADRLVLSTWTFNRGAQAFFTSLGYRVFIHNMWRRP